jgi:hypothetical protein
VRDTLFGTNPQFRESHLKTTQSRVSGFQPNQYTYQTLASKYKKPEKKEPPVFRKGAKSEPQKRSALPPQIPKQLAAVPQFPDIQDLLNTSIWQKYIREIAEVLQNMPEEQGRQSLQMQLGETNLTPKQKQQLQQYIMEQVSAPGNGHGSPTSPMIYGGGSGLSSINRSYIGGMGQYGSQRGGQSSYTNGMGQYGIQRGRQSSYAGGMGQYGMQRGGQYPYTDGMGQYGMQQGRQSSYIGGMGQYGMQRGGQSPYTDGMGQYGMQRGGQFSSTKGGLRTRSQQKIGSYGQQYPQSYGSFW